MERKPLLYDYYANTLNPIYDKRNFDEIDRHGMAGLNGKRSAGGMDEIDRYGMIGLHGKRDGGMDEIDRYGMVGLQGKRSGTMDPIDRFVDGLSSRNNFEFSDRSGRMNPGYKRNGHNRIIQRPGQHILPIGKREFDEIDNTVLSRLYKRSDNTKHSEDRYNKRKSMDMVYLADQSPQQQFSEVDRAGYTDFMKRYFDGDRAASDIAKQSFDEMDRFVNKGGKRMQNEADRFRSDRLYKLVNPPQNGLPRVPIKRFEDIDRVSGQKSTLKKRSVRNVADDTGLPKVSSSQKTSKV